MNTALPDGRAYLCPICNAPLRVTDSRPTIFMQENTVRRRRACPQCDHRFTTYEISEGNLMNRLQSERNARAALTEAATKLKEINDALSK